jgi:hypothetical protein
VASNAPARTHLGAAASDVVTLVTETSPTGPGVAAPLAFALGADGIPKPFAIPAGTALVVTDVIVTIPRSNARAGRYVASIANASGFHTRIPISVDTAADGFQKVLALAGAVVFTTLPEFQTLAGNPSDMSVWLYGYLAKRR